MNRKHFLQSLAGGVSLLPAAGRNKLAGDVRLPEREKGWIQPSFLRPGDKIGICCPAGNISLEAIQPAVSQVESWGYTLRIGETVGKKDFSFGGTDEERIKDFQSMLDDPELKAILCARGGYGSIRIIDKLDFTRFAAHPKWIIGFSDITVIHAHLCHNYRIASIHSKMCNSFPDDWATADAVQVESILSIRKVLGGEVMTYEALPQAANRMGRAEGLLVGGNLKTIESLAGSHSDLLSEKRILFVEDTGEYLYSLDRMFWSLKRTGKLDHLRGLIIGGFRIKPDDPGEEFGSTLYDIVMSKVSGLDYPVCFDFPVGHQKENYALACGLPHQLEVGRDAVTLRQVR